MNKGKKHIPVALLVAGVTSMAEGAGFGVQEVVEKSNGASAEGAARSDLHVDTSVVA